MVRTQKPVASVGDPVVILTGNFTTNAGSSPTAALNKGKVGHTVARTATGTYTITFDHIVRAILYSHCTQHSATANAHARVVSSVITSGILVVTVITETAGTPADFTADQIDFCCIVQTRGV